MQSFEVPDLSPSSFAEDVAREIARRELERYVEVTFDGHELVARISRLGTTVLRYRVSTVGSGFRARLTGQRVAPLHAPFRADFESLLERVVGAAGGTVTRS